MNPLTVVLCSNKGAGCMYRLLGPPWSENGFCILNGCLSADSRCSCRPRLGSPRIHSRVSKLLLGMVRRALRVVSYQLVERREVLRLTDADIRCTCLQGWSRAYVPWPRFCLQSWVWEMWLLIVGLLVIARTTNSTGAGGYNDGYDCWSFLRGNQGTKLVWRWRDATRPHKERAHPTYTLVHRDGRAPHAGMLMNHIHDPI